MRKNLYILFAMFVMASLILAACGGTIAITPAESLVQNNYVAPEIQSCQDDSVLSTQYSEGQRCIASVHDNLQVQVAVHYMDKGGTQYPQAFIKLYENDKYITYLAWESITDDKGVTLVHYGVSGSVWADLTPQEGTGYFEVDNVLVYNYQPVLPDCLKHEAISLTKSKYLLMTEHILDQFVYLGILFSDGSVTLTQENTQLFERLEYDSIPLPETGESAILSSEELGYSYRVSACGGDTYDLEEIEVDIENKQE